MGNRAKKSASEASRAGTGEGEGAHSPSPPPAQLASLADFFALFPTKEPGPRLKLSKVAFKRVEIISIIPVCASVC